MKRLLLRANIRWQEWLHERATGYVALVPLTAGESRWYAGYSNEFGLWSINLHGVGLHFSVIGPFRLRKEVL